MGTTSRLFAWGGLRLELAPAPPLSHSATFFILWVCFFFASVAFSTGFGGTGGGTVACPRQLRVARPDLDAGDKTDAGGRTGMGKTI